MSKKLLFAMLACVFGLGATGLTVWGDEDKGYGKGHRGGYAKGHESGHGRGFGMGHHGTAGHLIRGLLGGAQEMGLSDEQIKKLKDIKLDLDRTRIQAEADIKIAEKEARALMDDEAAPLSAIESKLKESAMKQVDLRLASVKARRDAMGVLTPEQSKRVKMFHERMRERMRSGAHGKEKGKHEKDDD